MLRIALVSYLNTRPFTDGLASVFSPNEIELQLLPPAECATALRNGKCDMALIPSGSLIDFDRIRLMKDHCIGANGAVDSVFIFAQQPIETCDHLLLDVHSRTSNGLAQILLKSWWKHRLIVEQPLARDFSQITGSTAGVAIGDSAYKIKAEYAYVYDLAQVWKDWTGLPFVFAVWAYAADRVSEEQLKLVRQGLEEGRNTRKKSARRWASTYGYTVKQAKHYLKHSISYEMDAEKHAAFHTYFEALLALEKQAVLALD